MKFYKNNSSLNFFISYAYLGLCYIFLLVLPVDGKAQLSQPEATKAQTIKQILAKNKFQNKQSKNTFCTQILSDLKTMNGITFMEPIARADSYDDPALAPFKKRCGEQPLKESFHCGARATTGIKLDRNWKKRRQQLAEICEAWYGTKNFKVFQLDINNNPKDGEELI